MTHRAEPLILTSDLDYWEVTLKNGGTIVIRAHGVSERDGYYRFMALMAGNPAYEYELVRLPVASVEDYEGGSSTPRTPRDGAIEGEP